MKRFLLILLLCLLLLSACSPSAPCQRDIFAMDTLINLKVWGDTSLLSELTEQIHSLDASLSVTQEDSDISRLNRSGSAILPEQSLALLQEALAYAELTDQAFDPTVYPLVSAWGFTREAYRVPSAQELSSLLPSVDTAHVTVDGSEVRLASGTQLDLGGIAKGYCAQCCADYLQERNVSAALLSFGGNVQTVGTKPDGSPWVIGIADPHAPDSPIAQLRFTGAKALVTSGSYQRYFEENGQRYHHILDPKTGLPVENGLASVTVIAENGTMADAYSTALFVMGMEQAVEFWKEEQGFEAVFITDDGSIFATKGAAALLDGCTFTEITT